MDASIEHKFHLDENAQFVGVVLQAKDPSSITFIANHGANLSYGMVLGLDAGENCIVLCIVDDIVVQYHLNDTKRFFSGYSSDDKLHKVARGSSDAPLYTQEIKCRVLGTYIHHVGRGLRPAPESIDRYTPMALQSVYLLESSFSIVAFGLDADGINIGGMQYPFKYKIEVPIDAFARHTLVSGVTGSGKSRLVGIISKKFALSGGCVTIIDPHDEYSNLLSADALIQNIHRYEMAPCPWSQKKWQHHSDEHQSVLERPLILSEMLLTPSSLSRLLPYISEQQEQVIHNYFQLAKQLDGSLIDNLKKILEDVMSKLPMKTQEKTDRADKADVLKAIISKLSFPLDKKLQAHKITDKIYINSKAQDWQEATINKISIICGDYNRSGIGKRFLAAIFEQFLRQANTKNKVKQLLVIEEAHQIFKLQDKSVQIALEQLLREARKFGITLMLVTQNESDIPESMRSQFQNYFIFRDPSNNEFKYLGEQCCYVKLYGGKSDFIMRVADCPSLIDSHDKRSTTI